MVTNYNILGTLDIIDKSYNVGFNFGLFQGSKNVNLELHITKNNEEIYDFTPSTITPYLVVYDRLDALTTAYQLASNTGITSNTTAGLKLVVDTNVLSDIVKYPNKCGLIFNMTDDNNKSIMTTEFEYYVIPNNAYDFIYGIVN